MHISLGKLGKYAVLVLGVNSQLAGYRLTVTGRPTGTDWRGLGVQVFLIQRSFLQVGQVWKNNTITDEAPRAQITLFPFTVTPSLRILTAIDDHLKYLLSIGQAAVHQTPLHHHAHLEPLDSTIQTPQHGIELPPVDSGLLAGAVHAQQHHQAVQQGVDAQAGREQLVEGLEQIAGRLGYGRHRGRFK